VQDGPVQPTQSDQLKFYGLYKQATIGDVNTSRPGMMGE
jgi:diazepam-binding inhibitor (GABA receptor modulating acyl-CoA-binding protein)